MRICKLYEKQKNYKEHTSSKVVYDLDGKEGNPTKDVVKLYREEPF